MYHIPKILDHFTPFQNTREVQHLATQKLKCYRTGEMQNLAELSKKLGSAQDRFVKLSMKKMQI